MKYLSTLVFLLAAAGAFAQSNTEVNFVFHHKAGSEPMVLGETIFPLWNGKKAILNRAAFYISKIDLVKPDNSPLPLHDLYLLVDAYSSTNVYPAGNWPINEITGVNLHLGVDSAHNHLDPSIYPEEHPLAHQKEPMHWGWVAGYRFMAIEGFVDNNNDGIPETELQFHNIGDDLYKSVQLSGVEQAENGVLNIHIELNYARLFQGMDMSDNLIEHGNSDANNLMMENAAKEGFLKIIDVSANRPDFDFSSQVTVTPNPADRQTGIRYDLTGFDQVHLSLVNANGQIVRQWKGLPAAGTLPIETGRMTNGIYQAVFFQNNRQIARKTVVVQH